VALETSELTRNNILMQAGTSVLQQANSIPKMALTLLQNT
jgi:flagellin